MIKRLLNTGLALVVAALLLGLGWTLRASAQTPDQDLIEQGARLYAENCAVCHGADGQGRVGVTLAQDWPSIRPDLLVRSVIERGVAGSPMPAWSQAYGGPLDEAQIDAIVAFILTWQTGGTRELAPSPTPRQRPVLTPLPDVAGDPNRGAQLYDQNCAVCHGDEGQGRVGATLAKSWSSIRPDLRIQATIANGIEGSPMPAWSQANGGPLTETDVDDLVAYILTWQGADVRLETATPELTTTSPTGWLTGWGGVLVFIVLFVAIVGIAIYYQIRRPSKPLD